MTILDLLEKETPVVQETDRFKVKVLEQQNSMDIYNGMARDPRTLYLLSNGHGYYGNTLLFTGLDISSVIETSVNKDSLLDSKILSTKATINYVDAAIDSTLKIRSITTHVVTAEEAGTGVFTGATVGDLGILFVFYTVINGVEQEVKYYTSYDLFADSLETKETSTIKFSVEDEKLIGNLKLKPAETILKILTANADGTGGGLTINANTNLLNGATDNEVPTAKSVVDYVTEMIKSLIVGEIEE